MMANDDDSYYENRFSKIRNVFALVSDVLRSVYSQNVQIPALCDTLWMYANIETYFTPNESYKKTRGDEIEIRKCDVRQTKQSSSTLLNMNSEEVR